MFILCVLQVKYTMSSVHAFAILVEVLIVLSYTINMTRLTF